MAEYITNKEFTRAIAEHNSACALAEAEGLEQPVIPRIIADQFITLAKKLGSRYNFANYSYLDEMVSNALFACCVKIRKFDIEVSTNAFAYFTNVCWRAMVEVINEEAHESYIKAKSFQYTDIEDSFDDSDLTESTDFSGSINDYVPYFDVAGYEKKLAAQKERAKIKKPKPEQIPGLDVE